MWEVIKKEKVKLFENLFNEEYYCDECLEKVRDKYYIGE